MSKEHIRRLAEIMVAKGIEQVVVSPGSRNAPVIILFGAGKKLKLLSVTDERSAGFFALGLAMQSKKTVALLCTSGSAVLNYAPAVAEAYYQKIPLLLLTADRPIELIDQGDSQTIRQQNVFANYMRKSFNLPVAVSTDGDRWYCDRIINEAIDRTQFPSPGPIQLNIPLDEPLYDLDTNSSAPPVKIISYYKGNPVLDESIINTLREQWNAASSKIILTGQMSPSSRMNELMAALSKDPSVSILTETTSNLQGQGFINCIDRTLAVIPPDKNDEYKPALLLTFGGAIVSKKIKAMLRQMHPEKHWHISIDPEEFHYDTYKSLTLTIAVQPEYFFEKVLIKQSIGYLSVPATAETDNSYSSKWAGAAKVTEQRHKEYTDKVAFSDFLVYDRLFRQLPAGTAIHLGNSTPVRYAQLFDHTSQLAFYANRGTSGIDGSTSTAAGFAYNYKGTTLLITGDVGFLYDSNGLWNPNLPATLRVIVINNGGGNIFRIIDGPTGHEELEPYIETRHSIETSGIAANFNIPYYRATNEEELSAQIPKFFSSQPDSRPAILEVITNNEVSAKTLKDYFAFLRG